MAIVGVLGCAADEDLLLERDGDLPLEQRPEIQRVPAPLGSAYCEIAVDGVGTIDMETDYLPHVVHCENGGADLEALKAQAIAARSVAYYAIATSGGICDGQGCQVYSCGSDPTPQQIQAVQETSGLYLNYNSTLTYAFFVAGDSGVAGPACVGNDGAASTEHWVTYNEGRTSTDVEQTELGFVHNPGDSGYGQNRGCMGQWSARCLETQGYDYVAMLRFFYGDDIGITQAPGECVLPLPGESTSSGAGPGDTTMAAESTGGEVDSTGEPPVTTTMPATTAPAESTNGASDSDAASESEGGAGTAGDGDDEPDALPDTFGENATEAGCGCSTRAPSPWSAALALVVLGLRRRRGR